MTYMHPFMMMHMIEYKIYVINQAIDKKKFNRGALLNVGYKLAMEENDWDCLILHDVDLLPENVTLAYTCRDKVSHIYTYIRTNVQYYA